jgi:oligopeptidase B
MHGFVKSPNAIAAPLARSRPVVCIRHGVELVDGYAWLRADNWQDVMRDPALLDPEIRAHLEAENAYTEAQLADTRDLQEILFAEMKGRIKEDDSSVPAPDGAYEYYASYVTGGQYPRLMRRPRNGQVESLLLDGNAEAEGKPYWQLGAAAHSDDHRLLAYAVDDKGSELFTVRIRDLETGRDLADAIPDTRGSVVWARDNRTLFYVRLDANHRPLSVYRHTVGTPAEDDVLVFEEKDIGFYVGVGQTQSGRFIQVDVHDHQTNEVYLIDADAPHGALRLVSPRRHGHEYQVEHQGERLIVTTNSGGAEDFRICAAPIATPGEEHWREMLPHKAGRLIIETVAFRHHIARLEREDSLPRIVITRIADGAEHAIAFDEEAYSLSMSSGYEFDTSTLRFVYSSMTTPAQVYDYDMETRQRTLRKTQEVPSGHDPDTYVTRRMQAPAPDGELVPVSVLYRKGTPLDGSAPLFLYGYGAYGIPIPAGFSTTRLSLVDRGFVFAIAHIRGGKDKGYRWYSGGKLEQKRNTFTDFIAAGEHLVRLGFTSRGRIVANGGSAGGMLMGVVANMAPDLFLGIIADVPFVDVLNTMLDETLPLTPPEWPEWGNPIVSERDFATIRSYSPYENVETKAYPHIFAYGGLTDPRVTYWEPAKWVARLREKNTSGNLILLKTNMEAGHGGASGRFEQLKEIAVDYAFALRIARLTGAPGA